MPSDAEAIREQLIGDQSWSIIGQSFGGFCVLRYLSAAPQHVKEALITGGIPSLTRPAEDVYRATYKRVAEKNRLFYQRYPEDTQRVSEIVRHLLSHDVRLPSGGRLTAQRFQQLGLNFGMSDGFENIHYLRNQPDLIHRFFLKSQHVRWRLAGLQGVITHIQQRRCQIFRRFKALIEQTAFFHFFNII